jgi:hypothetical protein
MRALLRGGTAAVAFTVGSVVGAVAPAQAAAPAVLYVNRAHVDCSDSGPGSSAEPFCTIGAAAAVVTAGQTVQVSADRYEERVTIAASGTPDQPIVIRGASPQIPLVAGPNAGFAIEGQHDIVLEHFWVAQVFKVPALDIRDSSAITVKDGRFQIAPGGTSTAVRLAGVTDSLLDGLDVVGQPGFDGVALDTATTGVTLRDVAVTAFTEPASPTLNAGIRVAGPRNKVVNGSVRDFTAGGIVVEPGATGTVVANNEVYDGAGYGIHNRGASGTAITNNTLRNRCSGGIRVDGASSGVSVHNNVLSANGHFGQRECPGGSPADSVALAIVDGAVGKVAVDYNNAHHGEAVSSGLFSWGGSRMGLAAFRSASGQAAHDRETNAAQDKVDSADSAAPGYQATDQTGKVRVDDPLVSDTGAGSVRYADRGHTEVVRGPTAKLAIGVNLETPSVGLAAGLSEQGIYPIASYRFSFGDGTTTEEKTWPAASHNYAKPGSYYVSVTVTSTDGQRSYLERRIDVLPAVSSGGLLSLYNLKYVATEGLGAPLEPREDRPFLYGEFDIADAGFPEVALVARANGRYISADPAGAAPLTMTSNQVGVNERFTFVRNADGSISFKSVANGRYISLMSRTIPHLYAGRTAIGTWEKFHLVKRSDAERTLISRANGKYVSAEQAGALPLIASRPGANTWEQFDIVDLGNGQIALFARANRHFVAAESNGTAPLQATRVAVGTWERFTMIRNSDGTVSFRSATNNLYVSAESAGAKPLIASRPAINTWEKFTVY